jgi:hypothetical protein
MNIRVKLKNISRIDSAAKRTHGWYVRVSWNQTIYRRFFSDLACGGMTRALIRAVEFRDDIEWQIAKPRTSHKQ